MRRSVVAFFTLSTLAARVALAVAAVSVTGCSSAPEAPGGGGPAGDGASVPDGGVQGLPSEPPPAPKAEQLTEAFGIFVTEKGSPERLGTRAAPLASIAAAILQAKAEKKSVFVCEGSYPEALVLESGVSIRGGLDCAGPEWKLTTRQSTVAAPTSPAVRATGVAAPTRIDNLAIVAPSAVDGGASGPRSSIGVLLVDSPALTFTSGVIRAGVARSGVNGVEPAALVPSPTRVAGKGLPSAPTCPDAGDPFGSCATPRAGGLGAGNQCFDPAGGIVSESFGGSGGGSGVFYATTVYPYWAALLGKAPGDPGAGSGATTTVQGTDGVSGVASFTDEGFVPGDGAAGTSGGPGAWGRGGRGQPPTGSAPQGERYWGRSGSGGGAGGCAGLAGTPGTGGGASVGVLALRSPTRLVGMTVEAGAERRGRGPSAATPAPASPGGTIMARACRCRPPPTPSTAKRGARQA